MIANPGDYASERHDHCAKCGHLKPISRMVRAPRGSRFFGKRICAECIDTVRPIVYNPIRETKDEP